MPDRRTTLLLFVFFQALYALTSSGNPFRVPDEFEVYFQTEHFVDAGDISVPQTLAIRQSKIVDGRVVGDQSVFYGQFGLDRRPYAPFGPFVAFLAVPHHLLARVVGWVAGVPRASLPDGLAWIFLVGGLTTLSSATGAALAVAGFHQASRAIGATPRTALVLSWLLGGATVLWAYGTSFYSEGWQAALLIWAAVLLLQARAGTDRRTVRVVAAALLLTLVGLTKVTTLLFTPWFLVAVILDRTAAPHDRARTMVALACGIGLAVLIHLAWNAHRFGDAFNFGYNAEETIPQMPPQTIRLADIPRGLVVLLATPGKSVILWAPVLMLAASSFREFWRRERGIAAALAGASAAALLFYAAYLFPEAGYANGPRQLVPLIPLLLLPAAARPIESRARAAVAVCAAIGVTMALLATAVSFFEDQSLGGDLASGARLGYYERIDPPPGRPWNRYRLGYVPFVGTLMSPGWLTASTIGLGPDYFPLHLLQARRMLRNGHVLPIGLIWGMPIFWAAVLTASGLRLRQAARYRARSTVTSAL
jgi:hypothetical protein